MNIKSKKETLHFIRDKESGSLVLKQDESTSDKETKNEASQK